MMYKWIGAILILSACGAFCVLFSISFKLEESSLQTLIAALDYMECELQFRQTPLPDLCRQAGIQSKGIISEALLHLSEELSFQISPDVESCMSAAIARAKRLPPLSKECLISLGQSLGRFDITGQIREFDAIRTDCRRKLNMLTSNRDIRIRNYQTLVLCAGAAIVILFI